MDRRGGGVMRRASLIKNKTLSTETHVPGRPLALSWVVLLETRMLKVHLRVSAANLMIEHHQLVPPTRFSATQ
eukprot:693771-Hanusia_phi.AAC.1